MNKRLFQFGAGITCMVLCGMLARSQTSQNSSGKTKTWDSQHMSSTGRIPQTPLRLSRIIGAEAKDSSGSRIGRVEDVVANPTSGKIDFAIIALPGTTPSFDPGAGYHTQNTGTSTGVNSGGNIGSQNAAGGIAASLQNGKWVPVPWPLVQPASHRESEGVHSFILNVNRTRLEQAPGLTRENWSDMSQPDWRQRVYAYYGISTGATGGAESPSGSQQGSDNR